jgi:hypothetical protein
MLLPAGMSLDPVPPADHPDQLIIRNPGIPAILPPGFLRELRQHRAPLRHIQRLARPEPRRPAPGLTRHRPRRTRHPRTPPAAGHRTQRRDQARLAGRRPLRRRGFPVRGRLPGLSEQRSQLPIIQPPRRRTTGILILTGLLQITRIIRSPRSQIPQVIQPLRPVRALRHQRQPGDPNSGRSSPPAGTPGAPSSRSGFWGAGVSLMSHDPFHTMPCIKHDSELWSFGRRHAEFAGGKPTLSRASWKRRSCRDLQASTGSPGRREWRAGGVTRRTLAAASAAS